MDILTVFCQIDDFCNEFEPRFNQMLLADGNRQRNKPAAMRLSEVMTILVMFHLSGYRNLKTFYNGFVCQYWRREFPALSSYTRFVERQRDALIPLWCYLHLLRGTCTGISFVDATTRSVRTCASRATKFSRAVPGADKPRLAGFMDSNCI